MSFISLGTVSHKYQCCSGVLHQSPFDDCSGEDSIYAQVIFGLNRQDSGRVKKKHKEGKCLTAGISAWSLMPHPVLFPLDHSSHFWCSHWIGLISKLVSSGKTSSFSFWHFACSFCFSFPYHFATLLSISLDKSRSCWNLLTVFWSLPNENLPLECAELTLFTLIRISSRSC